VGIKRASSYQGGRPEARAHTIQWHHMPESRIKPGWRSSELDRWGPRQQSVGAKSQWHNHMPSHLRLGKEPLGLLLGLVLSGVTPAPRKSLRDRVFPGETGWYGPHCAALRRSSIFSSTFNPPEPSRWQRLSPVVPAAAISGLAVASARIAVPGSSPAARAGSASCSVRVSALAAAHPRHGAPSSMPPHESPRQARPGVR